MKSGWISKTATKRKRKGKGKIIPKKTHEYSGPNSFSDLPKDILLNILLRLSVKKIFISKIVCKTWYELISDHEFAKLHYDQAESYPLIDSSALGMVNLIQPDKTDFELKLGMSCDHSSFKPGCVCNVHVKLDTIFDIPERTKKNERYRIVNSCNGWLYLRDRHYNNNPPIVCNPITGEFIHLPAVPQAKLNLICFNSGFGFSPASNQYKVIRMYWSLKGDLTMVDVHIIGTKTWKQIGCSINSMLAGQILLPIYLNGFLHWSSIGHPLSSLISFDIASECFELVLGPATDESCISVSVGVLGGEICISGFLESHVVHVWTMKNYGTEKAGWSKVFSFDLFNSFDHTRYYYRNFKPIKYLNDGGLLMFYSRNDAFIYMDPKTNRMRFLKLRGCGTDENVGMEVIAHIPCFVSLKRTFSGLNVKSRSAELKMQRKAKDIHLVEDELVSSEYD